MSWMSRAQSLQDPMMGTESMGPLLYWLMRSVRPVRVLEIGSGYTTLLMARANLENKQAFARERAELIHKSSNTPLFSDAWYGAAPVLADPGFYLQDFTPHLLTVDRRPEDDPDLTAIKCVLEEWGAAEDVEFAHENFQDTLRRKKDGVFDFVWFDCGGYAEYTAFIDEGWPLIDPAGGLLILHYTLTNLAMGAVVRQLKLHQATGGLREFELVSFLEPHKLSQNSFTVIRKIGSFQERIYEYPDMRMTQDIARLLMEQPPGAS